jgi:hypothetical protein
VVEVVRASLVVFYQRVHKLSLIYVEGFDFVFEFSVIRMQRRALHPQDFESVGEFVLLLAGFVGFDIRKLQLDFATP